MSTGAVIVGTWDLKPTVSTAAAESLFPDHGGEDGESTFADDNRKIVDARHFKAGEAIVKLQMRYEGQTADDDAWAMGTGWLIRPDLLVTAGHCAYDWGSANRPALGRAIQVKAYIGYYGRDSVKDADVQFRHCKRIASTSGWLKSNTNRQNDVSFMSLDKPFTGITPFVWAETPNQGTDMLGVVGYPADKRMPDKAGADEQGAQMYEQYSMVKWNLATAASNMLEYRISTYAGQSGSPVLRKDSKTSIAAHVYGGGHNNSASPIMGRFGNQYSALTAVFDRVYPTAQRVKNITYLTVNAPASNSRGEAAFDDTSEEGFFDTLKSVFKTVAPIAGGIIKMGSPFLGPIGAPVAALAGGVLGVAGRMCESSLDSGAEAAMPIDTDAHVARAMLGEAALQTVFHDMDHAYVVRSGIQEHMKKVYTQLAPNCVKLAPKLLPSVLGPSLRIALNEYRKGPDAENAFPSGPPRPLTVNDETSTESAMELDHNTEAFMEALLQPTKVLEGEEGFFGDLGNTIKKGLTIARPYLKTAATMGLQLLSNMPESTLSTGSDMDEHYELLAKRAVMGEAALQALMQVPAQDGHEEGWFDGFKSVVQKIGSTVVAAAPGVLKVAIPIVKSLLAPETAMSSGHGGRREPSRKEPGALRKKKSWMQALEDSNGNQAGPKLEEPVGTFAMTREHVEPFLDDNADGLAWGKV